MRSLVLSLVILVFSSAACHAADNAKQHASDQAQCAGYGYQQGTDRFADCMMKLDSQRQDKANSQKQSDSDMKARSIKRNGDERFPICSAAMMDASLDTTNNAWYGPNCREK